MKALVTSSLLVVAAASHVAAADPTVSVTSNPLVDALGFVDVQVEARVAPHLGVTAIAGGGLFAWQGQIPAYEVGAKLSYYPWRAFSGWHLAAAANYADVALNLPGSRMEDSTAFVAAYAGYKWLGRSGFTAEARIGAAYLANQPYDPVQPMVSSSLGYSF